MSLPPLPPKDIDNADCQAGHSDDSMQAYGRQCRAEALEEAASLCDGEKWNDSGKPVAYIAAFNEGCTDCEAVIRRLK